MDIGSRIRQIRKSQSRTVREIAEVCGLSKSMITKIEAGITTPAIATMMNIAKALGSDVSVLIGESVAPLSAVMTKAEEITPASMARTQKGYAFHAFAQKMDAKSMQPYLFILKKGRIRKGGLSHGGQEFIYVLSGKMTYRVGSAAYTLGPGDSLYFNGYEEHDFIPVTNEVKYLGIISRIS